VYLQYFTDFIFHISYYVLHKTARFDADQTQARRLWLGGLLMNCFDGDWRN